MRRTRWALFLSGRGSNAQVAFDLQSQIDLVLVVSNTANAPGVCKARRHGVPVYITEKKIDWDQVHQQLLLRQVDFIFLLGFMKVLPARFVNLWAGRIINLHPSLLPAYPGLAAIEKSYSDGAAMGVTVHLVVAKIDAGPILLQQKVLSPASGQHHSLTLRAAQFLISRTEQRLVREVFLRGTHWIQQSLP